MGLRDKVTIIGARPNTSENKPLSAADEFLAAMMEGAEDTSTPEDTAADDSDDTEEVTDSGGDDIPIELGGNFDNTPDFDK